MQTSIQKSNKTCRSLKTAPTFVVQCKDCQKWRVIPLQEEYEEIRKNVIEVPFTCKRKENVSCDDAGDLEWDSSRIWTVDKPNLPKSPPGFKRKLSMRHSYNRMDCYYVTPSGKNLRSPTEVATFLLSGHDDSKGVLLEDFDFRAPKIATTAPGAVSTVLRSP